MPLRIPQNQIIESKYTVGGEYLLLSTYKEYQGYYYEFDNKFFAGKEYNINAPEIIKRTSDKVNPLLLNPATETYGKISNIQLNKKNKISSIPIPSGVITIRYFAKKINVKPIIIKEINKDTYDEIQSNPIYQTLSVNFNYNITEKELDELDKKMPGIKIYLQDDINNIPTSSDENNPFLV